MDPNLRNFAVFINSASSTLKSTEKSQCAIPFNGNLSSFDPGKVLKVAINQFLFTNSVYNVDSSNNKLTVCAQFAEGRGYDQNYKNLYGERAYNRRLWQTWNIEIPPGSYNTQQLASYLSEQSANYAPQNQSPVQNRVGYESISQAFVYAEDLALGFPQSYTYQNCFVGFGSNPFNEEGNFSPGVSTVDNNSKIIFQSADLLRMVQYGTDIDTPCTNIIHPATLNEPQAFSGSGTLDYSMVYRGVHLIFNADSAPLLKMLGFFNIDTYPPDDIEGYCNNQGLSEAATGYSLYFKANVLNEEDGIYPTTNVTYYTFDSDPAQNQLVNVPTYLVAPAQAIGHTYHISAPESRELFFLAKADDVNNIAEGYINYDPGLYVQGQGFSSPFPFITDFVKYDNFVALFTLDSVLRANYFDIKINLPITVPPTSVVDYLASLRVVRGAPLRISNLVDAVTKVPELLVGYYVQKISDDGVTITLSIYSASPVSNVDDYSGISLTLAVITHTLSNVADVDIQGPSTDPPDPPTFYAPYYYNLLLTYEPLGVVSSQLIPNNLTNLEGLGEIHVHCPELKTEFFSATTGSSLAPSDVICVVPVTEPFGSKQSYAPPVNLEAFLTNTNIVVLNFRLTDSNNRLLDFNGLDWSMVLKCEELDVSKTLLQDGLLNTPYQDQLNVLEGTARQEIKARGRKLPYEFYDSDKKHKSNPFNQYFIR